MATKLNERYLAAYYANERDANKQMTFVCAVSGGLLAIMWVFYLTGLFKLSRHSLFLANVAILTCIGLLLAPLALLKTGLMDKRGYKYALVIDFLIAVSFLNVVLPKHVILAWAIPIILVNHYYNPRLGRITFGVTAVMMLICLYLGMLFGEFDPYLLGGEVNSVTETITSQYLPDKYPDTTIGRIEFLRALRDVAHTNRYVTAFGYYYVGRITVLTIVFFASNALNKRTYKLFLDEFRANEKQNKISNDLNIAKDIQLSSLPNGYYCSPRAEITAELCAAREVGGDFYQYVPLDDSHIAIAIGDVSGKGIPAAMFMMRTITCLKNFLAVDKSPAETLREVNRALYDGNENQVFVTCFLGIIDLDKGRMTFANAGHNQPIFGQPKRLRYLPCEAGFLLGVMPEAKVQDEVMPVRYGDMILLYTDGVTEARNEKGEFYGEKRLLQFLNSKEFSCPLEVSRGLTDTIGDFSGAAEQADDITHLLIQVSDNSKTHSDDRHLDAVPESAPILLSFIRDFAIAEHLDKELVSNLLVIGDELISNIIKYAYGGGKGDIYLRLMHNEREFVMTFVDHGKPFNALEVERPKLMGEAKDQPVGGLGILIVKQIMDVCTYDYLNKKNILILRKKIQKETSR